MGDLNLSRRTLLGGAGLSLGGLGLGGLPPTRRPPPTRQGPLPAKVDVVVVGGGISGLVAARQVARSGRSVLRRRGPRPRRRPGAQPPPPRGRR